MTNYNERLDDVLANLVNQVAANEQRLLNGNAIREETIDSDSKATIRAKRAITSLNKELVAEAKPEEYKNYYTSNPVEKGHKMGYNEAVRDFEQNLLKAFKEEV